jgi:hypothetical protein
MTMSGRLLRILALILLEFGLTGVIARAVRHAVAQAIET